MAQILTFTDGNTPQAARLEIQLSLRQLAQNHSRGLQ
jgi:hypothetical protein